MDARFPCGRTLQAANFLRVDIRFSAWSCSTARCSRSSYRGRLDDEASCLVPIVAGWRASWYVYTTFTPIEARRAFPCFDEPRFKTPWEISIRVPQGDKAFSNAHLVEETGGPRRTEAVPFRPDCSACHPELVAFAVGPFDVYDGGAAGQGTPIRVVTPNGHAAEGQAGAEATRQVLPRLEAYTGIPVSL